MPSIFNYLGLFAFPVASQTLSGEGPEHVRYGNVIAIEEKSLGCLLTGADEFQIHGLYPVYCLPTSKDAFAGAQWIVTPIHQPREEHDYYNKGPWTPTPKAGEKVKCGSKVSLMKQADQGLAAMQHTNNPAFIGNGKSVVIRSELDTPRAHYEIQCDGKFLKTGAEFTLRDNLNSYVGTSGKYKVTFERCKQCPHVGSYDVTASGSAHEFVAHNMITLGVEEDSTSSHDEL